MDYQQQAEIKQFYNDVRNQLHKLQQQRDLALSNLEHYEGFLCGKGLIKGIEYATKKHFNSEKEKKEYRKEQIRITNLRTQYRFKYRNLCDKINDLYEENKDLINGYCDLYDVKNEFIDNKEDSDSDNEEYITDNNDSEDENENESEYETESDSECEYEYVCN